MEFVTQHGALGGFLVLAVVASVFALVLFLSFELARLFRAYDYRSFFQLLLGKYWFLYEIFFVAMLVLVLAVSTSAAGTILEDTFAIPYWIGAFLVLVGIVVSSYYGRRIVEISLTYGMIAFTSVLLLYVVFVFIGQGDKVISSVMRGGVNSGWALDGMRFAFYNCFVIPPLLYVAREFETRREVMRSGIIAALSGILPAIIFHLAFLAGLPEVIDQAVPTYWMIQELQIPVFLAAFTIVLFVMIVQTGVGILQGVNERLDAFFIEARGTRLNAKHHALISASIFILSSGLSVFGVIALVAMGYGAMGWCFVVVYLLPLVTRGTWLVFARSKSPVR